MFHLQICHIPFDYCFMGGTEIDKLVGTTAMSKQEKVEQQIIGPGKDQSVKCARKCQNTGWNNQIIGIWLEAG